MVVETEKMLFIYALIQYYMKQENFCSTITISITIQIFEITMTYVPGLI